MYYAPTLLKLKFKKLNENAKVPAYSRPGDAGLDLVATSKTYDEKTDTIIFGLGLAVEIPQGYVGLVTPRSSIYKTPLMLSNGCGIIDSNYRGELKAIFRPIDRPRANYEVGDKICQLVIVPCPIFEPVEVEDLSETNRGDQGFGSSGR